MSAPGTRVQVIHEIGVKIDDALEKAQLDTARREGAHEAYKSAAKSLAILLEQVDKEHAGRDAVVAKAWINRVVNIFKTVADQTGEQMQVARGAEKQTRAMVEMLKQMYDAEAKTVPVAVTPPQPAPAPKLIPASPPAVNVAPAQAPKPAVVAPPAPPPVQPKPAPVPPPPSSTTPGTTPRMPVKPPTPPAPPPPPPPPPAPAPEPKKPGRKPKKESKQPEPPPPPPAPPKRTRPISIKERRNKGME